MEKKQHLASNEEHGNEKTFSGNQPGQQPPSGEGQSTANKRSNEQKKERHSESSFPKQGEETLGTPWVVRVRTVALLTVLAAQLQL